MAMSVIAAVLLVGGSGAISAAAPAIPAEDCDMQVLPAGNGYPTWLATLLPTGGVTLSQNGTMSTGQVFDLAATVVMTDKFGDTLQRIFPYTTRTWYPVVNAAGTDLMEVLGCFINR
jgi:hypothetical protein